MSFKRLGGRTGRACVSSAPSKIPYGGFSPVRLQTGRQRQPSPSRAYMPLKPRQASRDPAHQGSRRTVSASSDSRRSIPVQRPLARRRVILSRRLNATMASSAPLVLSRRLIRSVSTAGLCTKGQGQRVPNLSCLSVDPCRCLYPGGRVAQDCWISTRVGLRPMLKGSASANIPPEVGSRRGYLSGLTAIRLTLRPGSLLALHRQGRLRSSFPPMSHLTGTSNMTTRPNSQLPRPD
jgi:hypothetical protein